METLNKGLKNNLHHIMWQKEKSNKQ